MLDRVLNMLLRNILSFTYFTLLTGLGIRFFEMYKALGTIILREREKLAGGFMEHLLLVHRPNKLQGIPLTR